MKIFKQLLTVFFLVFFLIGTKSIKAQEASKTKEIHSFNLVTNTSNLSYDSNVPYVFENYYLEIINSTIKFTLEKSSKKVIPIDDSSNYFSDAFLAQVIVNSNKKGNNSAITSCAWKQILHKTYVPNMKAWKDVIQSKNDGLKS